MKRVKLLSWNVNGVRAAVKKGALETLKDLDIDIICLQEIKAKPEQFPPELLEWAGYTHHIYSAERPGYSGVAIFSRLPVLGTTYGWGDPRFDSEGRALFADFGSFRLLNCYFPNGGNGPERLQYKMDFYEEILRLAQDQPVPLIIGGDVNTAHQEIDLARPKENSKVTGFLPMERDWIDRFLATGYLDTFRMFNSDGGHYSWWDMKSRARDRNVGWRIDYFLAPESLREQIKAAYILPEVLGSDHCPVVLELEVEV